MASCGLEQTHQMTGEARREDAAFPVSAARQKRLRASVCAVLCEHCHAARATSDTSNAGVALRSKNRGICLKRYEEMIPCSEIFSVLTVYLLHRELMPTLFSSSFKIMLNSICSGFHQTKQRRCKNAGYDSPQPKNDKLEGFFLHLSV